MTWWNLKRTMGSLAAALLSFGLFLGAPVSQAASLAGHHNTPSAHLTPREELARALKITQNLKGTLPLKYPYPAFNIWSAVDFVNSADGWVAGNGRIMATQNGGARWTTQYRGRLPLAGLKMWNAQIGYAYSPHEILATENGGSSWQGFRTPAANPYQVIPVGPHALYLVADGRVFQSRDNGAAWTRIAMPARVASLAMDAAGTGYAVSAPGSVVWKTVDGGKHWVMILKFHPGTTSGGSIAVDGRIVWAVIDGGYGMNQQSYTIYRSADAGGRWLAVAAHPTAGGGPSPGNPGRQVPVMQGAVLAQFTAVSANSAILTTGCWACGDGTAALSLTTDGGTHWTNLPNIAGYSGFSASVSFLSPARGWMATGAGLILATTDGGRTWSPQYPTTRPAPVYGWSWLTNRIAFGLGTVGNANVLLQTTTGGASWRVAARIPSRSNAGYVPFAPTQPIDFLSKTDGWLVSSTSGQLAHYISGRFIPVPISTFRSKANPTGAVVNVYFLNRRLGGVSTGVAGLSYVTADGGRTWHRSPYQAGSTAVLAMKNPHLAQALNQLSRNSYVIGYDTIGIRGPQLWMPGLSGMFYSHNEGRSWVYVASSLGNAMLAESPSGRLYIYIAGQYFTSRNDGVSWLRMP